MQMQMEMQAMEEEERDMRSNSNSNNSVICLLTNPEGEPLGAPLYLPQNSGPPQLQEIVNKLLNNVLLSLPFFPSKYAIFFRTEEC